MHAGAFFRLERKPIESRVLADLENRWWSETDAARVVVGFIPAARPHTSSIQWTPMGRDRKTELCGMDGQERTNRLSGG
jgi:hypothetical protein